MIRRHVHVEPDEEDQLVRKKRGSHNAEDILVFEKRRPGQLLALGLYAISKLFRSPPSPSRNPTPSQPYAPDSDLSVTLGVPGDAPYCYPRSTAPRRASAASGRHTSNSCRRHSSVHGLDLLVHLGLFQHSALVCFILFVDTHNTRSPASK